MNNFVNVVDKYRYAILLAVVVHLVVWLFLLISTYETPMKLDSFAYSYKNKEIQEDIEFDPEDLILPEDYQMPDGSEVRNMVKDQNDSRTKTYDDKFYTSSQSNSQSVEDYENQIKNELNAKHPTKADDGSDNSENKQDNTKTSDKTDNNTSPTSNNAFAGRTMVEWSLSGRSPHNNNDYYVRNPGYTCGAVAGTITMRIKVDQNGDVISAKYDSNMSNSSNECMLRQAEKYALKSRFDYSSSNKSQEGTITYTFTRQ